MNFEKYNLEYKKTHRNRNMNFLQTRMADENRTEKALADLILYTYYIINLYIDILTILTLVIQS